MHEQKKIVRGSNAEENLASITGKICRENDGYFIK
jgi:hypothetical protein